MKRIKKGRNNTNRAIVKTKKKSSPLSEKFSVDKKEYIALFSIVILFFTIASSHLGKFFTTDETAWFYSWITQYWEAYFSGNFSDIPDTTYPGAFHSFITGITNLFLEQNEFMSYDKIETYLYWWRFPILFFNALSLILIYHLLRNFFTKQQSLAIVFLTAFSPIIFGMSRIVNSDSVLWNTTLISILSFLLLFKEQKNKYLILSGIFMGFALASKYNAIIIFLYQIIILPLQYFNGKTEKKFLKSLMLKMFLVWIIALSVFSILYPEAIVSPRLYWLRIFRYFITNPLFIGLFIILTVDIFILKAGILSFFKNKLNIKFYLYKIIPLLFIALIAATVSIKLFNVEPESWSANSEQWKMPFSKSLFENIYGFLYSTQIIIIAGILLFGVITLFKKYNKKDYSLPVYMIIFILIFILGTSLQGVKTGHRYIIVLFPFSIIVAVWAFSQFKKVSLYLFALAAILSLTDIALLYPKHYVLYRNTNYFPEQNKYFWSLGVYDMAQELNNEKDAENLSVLSDRPGFSLFFKGKTEFMQKMYSASEIKEFDYLYLSKAGYKQNAITQPLEDYYNTPTDEYKYSIGNPQIGWAAIIKVDKNKKELEIENTFDPKYYIDLEKEWSISFWTQNFAADAGNIFYIGKDYKTGIEFFVKKNNFNIRYSDNQLLSTNSLDTSKLNNIIWTHKNVLDNQTVSLWLNGDKISEQTVNNSKTEKPKFLISTNYKGLSEDFRIYNIKLSKKQINVLYNKGVNSEIELYSEKKKFIPIQSFSKKGQ